MLDDKMAITRNHVNNYNLWNLNNTGEMLAGDTTPNVTGSTAPQRSTRPPQCRTLARSALLLVLPMLLLLLLLNPPRCCGCVRGCPFLETLHLANIRF